MEPAWGHSYQNMLNYPVSLPQEQHVPEVVEAPAMKKEKKKKDHEAPRKPRTAYIIFSVEHRKGLGPTVSFNDATKICAEAWRAATEEDRRRYEEQAMEEKTKYQQEMAAYQAKKAEQARFEQQQHQHQQQSVYQHHMQYNPQVPYMPQFATMEEAAYMHHLNYMVPGAMLAPPPAAPAPVAANAANKKRKRDPNAPKKPRTAYIIFSVEHRARLGNTVTFSDATKLAAEAWREAPEDVKKQYEDMAAAEKVRYEGELAEYKAAGGVI